MHAIDASVWVSRFVPADIYHAPSVAHLAALVRRGELMVSPALLLAEVAGAVARRTGLPDLGLRAATSLEALSNVRLVPVDVDIARLSARLAAELHLKGSDAMYVAVASRLKIPLITWDQEQRTRAVSVITVLTPQQVPSG